MASKGVSIIICCYNSSLRLPETLKHISLQQSNVLWEVVLVDNNSSDQIKEIAQDIWESLTCPIELRIVEEIVPGLSAARKRGIVCSKYDYLIFCDDDNWLGSNYVNDVYEIFENNAEIGIIGGNGAPVTEVKPPTWFNEYIHSYAAFPQSEKSRFLNGVYGAGMGIRKKYYLGIVGTSFNSFLSDRKGEALSSGGDSELCYLFRLNGYKIWYDERLKFKHFIPKHRLEWDYLRRLHIGFAKSFVILKLYENALNKEADDINSFYWLQKAFYYWAIFFKYWPRHYRVYKKGIGSVEEIHHLTWKIIGMDYMSYNFKTIGYYNRIVAMKRNSDGK